MFQAATATSRVQAKNAVITQGIEIMSLMCKVYESVNTPNGVAGAKKVSSSWETWRNARARGKRRRDAVACPFFVPNLHVDCKSNRQPVAEE